MMQMGISTISENIFHINYGYLETESYNKRIQGQMLFKKENIHIAN
jgi:hypothetical protein